jgi:rhodanese-related sulfurtransferase
VKVFALQLLVIISLTAVATVLSWQFHPRAPALYLNAEPLGDGEISIEDALLREAQGGVIWIDARSQAKFEMQHIPGAILLNEFDFNRQLMDSFHLIANQDQAIIVYCGTHACKSSTKIADELREKMIPDVFVLKGGWDRWLEAKTAAAGR